MSKVPDIILSYAKHITSGGFHAQDDESRLNELRQRAIDSIGHYREFKDQVLANKKVNKEISDWLAENNLK